MITRLSIVKAAATLAVLTVATFGLAACGDDDSSETVAETSAPAETTPSDAGAVAPVAFEADPSGALAYTTTTVKADAGEATVEFDNPSSTPHNVVIEDDSGGEVAETDTITGSATSTTAALEPGTYAFYCSVSGHREAGMEGTLTVK